jgi:hypothetical protein
VSASLSAAPDVDEPVGVTLNRLAVLLVLTIAAARTWHVAPDPAWAVVGVVTVWSLAASRSWVTPWVGAALAWFLGTGFLAHATGELSFGSDDRLHAALLGVAALVASLVSARARYVVRRATP